MGKKDNEIKGTGNSLEFKFRIYDSRLGKFLSVDPLTKSYPYYSPYHFAGNRPIDCVDVEGREPENAKMKYKVWMFGTNSLKVASMKDGFGDVQRQTYNLAMNNVDLHTFNKMKAEYTSNPAIINNNFLANYYPCDDQGNKRESFEPLKSGDIIKIDIFGPMTNCYVKVFSSSIIDNKFSMTFETLEGHTDAGYITFTATFTDKGNQKGTVEFSIQNVTRVNNASSLLGGRALQKRQWRSVIKNAEEYIQDTNEEASPGDSNTPVTNASQTIETFEWNEETSKPGKAIGKPEITPIN